MKIDKSVYFRNGGIRVKPDKVIINIEGQKEFLGFNDILDASLGSSKSTGDLLFRITTDNKTYQLQGEKFLVEDAKLIQSEIKKKIGTSRPSRNRQKNITSISEHFLLEGGDVHQGQGTKGNNSGVFTSRNDSIDDRGYVPIQDDDDVEVFDGNEKKSVNKKGFFGSLFEGK